MGLVARRGGRKFKPLGALEKLGEPFGTSPCTGRHFLDIKIFRTCCHGLDRACGSETHVRIMTDSVVDVLVWVLRGIPLVSSRNVVTFMMIVSIIWEE